MNKKIIFAVLLIYLSCTLVSPIVFAEEEIKQTQMPGIFAPEITFEYENNLTNEPINPLQIKEIDINVKFKLDMNSFVKWFLFKRRIGRLLLFGPSYIFKFKAAPSSNLNITISESPTWCTANIDTNIFQFNFDDIYKNKNSTVEKTVKLDFTINENAIALDTGNITIQADFMGLWTIKGVSNSISIPVAVAYVPDIQVDSVSELTIPPLKNTSVAINITNNGNGDSIISITYSNPENWTTSFDQEGFTLEIGETKEITFTVNPPKEFTNHTINFSFIPKSAAGEYSGTPIVSSIKFINDGSLEEGTKDVIIVGIIILIIIILLLLTLLFLRKKKE